MRLRGHCEAGFEGRGIRPGVVEAVEAERAFTFDIWHLAIVVNRRYQIVSA